MIEAGLCIIGLVGILSLVVANVVMRYLFHSPLGWTQEVVMYMFIATSVLGISVAYRRGRHLQLYGIQALLTASTRRVLRLIVSVVVATFLVYLIVQAFQLHELFQRFYSPLNRMPRSWLTLALLWSLTSMLISTLYFIAELAVSEDVRPIDIFARLGLAGNLSHPEPSRRPATPDG